MDKKYCLCCGEEIFEGTWHHRCIRKFFYTDALPELHVDEKNLKDLAIEQLTHKKSVTGVQEKLSLHLDLGIKKRPKLTIVGYPTGYILKTQSARFKQLPEFEHTAMLLAELCGLDVVPHALIEINDKKELAYITKRIDRTDDYKIHMEDFCQATNTLTFDKYRGSYEECAALIDKYSKNPVLDKALLFRCLYFCFIIGNSDVHLKNFSFVMDKNGNLSLSKFYDLIPTKVILPTDQDELGMRFNGKKNGLTRKDFIEYAEKVGISSYVYPKIMQSINNCLFSMEITIKESLLNQNAKTKWIKLIRSNIKRMER